MLPTIDMSEPMQEAVPAFVVGSDLAQVWSCGTTLPMSAALADAVLSFSGAPLFVLNMSTSCRWL
jgi:imidazoleglycerol phosphate dehydratase HisB